MHPNPAFRKREKERNIEFARERAFGSLCVNAEDGPVISHIPFLLDENAKSIELHLVRSNPIVKLLQHPQRAVISVVGGDSYISPDWYEVEDQVPTWNYVSVHLRGELQLLSSDELHGVLERLSASIENRLKPKTPWTSEKMDQNVYTRMQRQIVPARLDVEEISGTWKLSQNKTPEVRARAAEGVRKNKMGSEVEELSNLMKDANE